jgi:hypothetical protein
MGDEEHQMLEELQDSLEDIGYTKIEDVAACVSKGLDSQDFIDLVSHLAEKIKDIEKLEEGVGIYKPGDDSQGWKMEVSSYLRELGCPYSSLIEEDVSTRFASQKSRLMLVNYLISELMASQMTAVNKPKDSLHIKVEESPTARSLKAMLLALGFPKPPENITPLQLFDKVQTKVKEAQSRAPKELINKPIFTKQLSAKQWNELEGLETALNAEYTIRRKMLLTRLDATVQSFSWSDRMKGREGEIAETFSKIRSGMKDKPNVGLPDLLAAREDALIVEKVSSKKTRTHTQTSLNKVSTILV